MNVKKQDSQIPDYALVERHQMLRGLGYGEEALNRPYVGVVSTWGEINPAAKNLDRIAAMVKAGIWSAGGTPREFVISSICTSMAGHDNYHLPHRDLVAGYIETAAMTNLFDAMVFVPVCDDVIPGHLMAAARLNLPSIFVTGGYMLLNRYKGESIQPLDVASVQYSAFREGRMYVIKTHEGTALRLNEFFVESGGAAAQTGGSVCYDGAVRVAAEIGATAEPGSVVRASLIKNGGVIRTFEGASPLHIRYEDERRPQHGMDFYRIEADSGRAMLIGNPIFVAKDCDS